MKKFKVNFQGNVVVTVDESDITEDENIKDIAINEFDNKTWGAYIEDVFVNSVEEI